MDAHSKQPNTHEQPPTHHTPIYTYPSLSPSIQQALLFVPIVYFSCGFALSAGDALFFFAAFLVCVTVSRGGEERGGGAFLPRCPCAPSLRVF